MSNLPQAQAADELVLSNGSLKSITVFYKLTSDPSIEPR